MTSFDAIPSLQLCEFSLSVIELLFDVELVLLITVPNNLVNVVCMCAIVSLDKRFSCFLACVDELNSMKAHFLQQHGHHCHDIDSFSLNKAEFFL